VPRAVAIPQCRGARRDSRPDLALHDATGRTVALCPDHGVRADQEADARTSGEEVLI